MARLPTTTEPSKVYVGMLIVTAVAMLVGITALVLEGGEYDWVQKPSSVVAPKLPETPKDEKSSAAISPKPFEAVRVPEAAPSFPAAVPAPLPIVKPDAVAEAPKPVEPTPTPSGPIPSPLVIPGR